MTTHPESLTYFTSLSFFEKIGNSFLLSATVSATAVLAGALSAYLFFGLKAFRHRVVMLFFSLIIFSISPVIYLVALTRYEIFNMIPAFWQSVLVLTLNTTPLPFAIFIFTVGAMNKSSLDVAFLSATPGSVLRHIVLPQLFSPVVISVLIIFMMVFTHQEVPSFLGYRTYAEEFLSRIVVMTDLQEASIAALPFLLLGCLVVLCLVRTISKTHLYNLFEQKYQPISLFFQKNHIVNKIICFLSLLVLPLIFINLFKHIVYSEIIPLLFENLQAVRNSLFLALLSATIGTACACLMYNLFTHNNRKLTVLLSMTIMLFYWLVPSSLIALGLIGLSQILHFNSEAFDTIVLLLGYQTKLLPIAILIVAALELIHRQPDDTVIKVMEISKRNIFTKLIFPLHWPKWLLTATVLIVLALNDLSVTVLLIPPGIETIVIRIYNLMHYGDYSLVAFLSFTQVLIVSVLVVLTAGAIRINDKS